MDLNYLRDQDKRYRVTRTGTARPSGQLIEPDGGALVAPDDPGTTVELLPDPLPTAPGSVVRTSHGKTFVRTMQDTEWPWLNPNASNDLVADDYFKPGFTVLFDAGAERA